MISVIGVVPLLSAERCVEREPRFFPSDAAPALDSGDGDAARAVVPFVECTQPDEATLVVESSTYNIQCGCEEAFGRTCTVNVGTRVTWQFADGEAHNVTSIASAFGMSQNQLVGSFSYEFSQVGTYGYGCSIHAEIMSGYRIIVK
jgi:plastocyanin